MGTVVDALYKIKYNPFKFGEYIASFYSEIKNVDNNLLLAPIIIPLCSHPVFKTKLEGAVFGPKKQSSLWSIFDDRTKLYDLQERVDEFKILTNQSIHYCLVNDWLAINVETLTLSYLVDKEVPMQIQKNAENLGKLLSGLSITEIYAFLGVKPR